MSLVGGALVIQPAAFDGPPSGVAGLIGIVLLANFSLLCVTPVLVTLAALVIEISPWALAIVTQATVLFLRLVMLAIVQGVEVTPGNLFGSAVSILIAAAGVLIGGFGYNRVADFMGRRAKPKPAANPESGAGTPPVAPNVSGGTGPAPSP